MTLLVNLPLESDLVDGVGTLAAGEMKRVSGGTYIDADGVMQTARGNRTNLVERSEDFSLWWTANNVTLTDGTSDPDGGSSADYMKADATATESRSVYKNNQMSPDEFYILSVYAKKADIDFLRLATTSHANNTNMSYFNLSTGAWGTAAHSTKGFTDVGDGWYRVWVLIDSESGGTDDRLFCGMSSTDATNSYAGTINEGIYIWGAQLEKVEGYAPPPGVEELTDPTLSDAAEWNDADGNVTHNDVAGTVTWDGLGAGTFPTTAGAGQFIVGHWYAVQVVVDSMTAGTLRLNNTSYAFQGTNDTLSAAGTHTVYVECTNDLDLAIFGDATCDAVVSNISVKEITMPGALSPGTYTATAGATAAIPAEARFETDGLLLEGAATNHCLYSNSLDSWPNSGATAAQNVTGPDGVANSAWTVTDPGGSAYKARYRIFNSLNGTDQTCSVFVKEGTSSSFSVAFYDTDASSWRARVDFQWTSGVLSVKAEDAGTGEVEQISDTDYWRVAVHPTGIVAANIHRFYIYASEASVDPGASVTVIYYGAQVEATAYKTSYIPTTTSPVTRTTEAGNSDDTGVSWTITQALKNILDDAEPVGTPTDSQGTLLFDVKWGMDESVIPSGDYGLVAVRDGATGLTYFTHTQTRVNDATNYSNVTNPAFSAGDLIHYASRWGDVDGNANDLSAGLRENDGSWSFDATPSNYDGSFTLGTDLRLSYANEYPIHIKHIQFHDTPFEQSWMPGTGGFSELITFGIF